MEREVVDAAWQVERTNLILEATLKLRLNAGEYNAINDTREKERLSYTDGNGLLSGRKHQRMAYDIVLRAVIDAAEAELKRWYLGREPKEDISYSDPD